MFLTKRIFIRILGWTPLSSEPPSVPSFGSEEESKSEIFFYVGVRRSVEPNVFVPGFKPVNKNLVPEEVVTQDRVYR